MPINDNKKLAQCKLCKEDYCMNCSDHPEWLEFCSTECADEWKKENALDEEHRKLQERGEDVL